VETGGFAAANGGAADFAVAGGVTTGGFAGADGVETGGFAAANGGAADFAVAGGVPEGGVPEGGVPEGGVPEGGVPAGGVPAGGFAGAGAAATGVFIADEVAGGDAAPTPARGAGEAAPTTTAGRAPTFTAAGATESTGSTGFRCTPGDAVAGVEVALDVDADFDLDGDADAELVALPRASPGEAGRVPRATGAAAAAAPPSIIASRCNSSSIASLKSEPTSSKRTCRINARPVLSRPARNKAVARAKVAGTSQGSRRTTPRQATIAASSSLRR
jgi:hypothetical protein